VVVEVSYGFVVYCVSGLWMKFCFIYLLQLYQDIKPCPLYVLMHVALNYNISCLSIHTESRSSVWDLRFSWQWLWRLLSWKFNCVKLVENVA